MANMLLRLLRPAPPAEESRPLALPDGRVVEVRWVRHPRARRLRLLVGERGARLTLPMRAPVRAAEAFLLEHRDWLAAQLATRLREPVPALVRGEARTLPLRGDALPLRWTDGRYARASLDEHGIALQLPGRATDAQARAALRDFYLQQARADVHRWLPRYVPDLPRPPASLRVRALSSLWGSLSPAGVVSLDLALVLGRPSAFEYVLVHELCHLVHADHSPRFWREVEARWPGWRDERDYLRGDGLALKATLAALTG